MATEADITCTSASFPNYTSNSRGRVINFRTIRDSLSAYICLEMYCESGMTSVLDELSVHTYIVSALTQFLGLTGAAIPFDILKVNGSRCWIRTAREDLVALLAAIAAWHGASSEQGRLAWKIKAKGKWLSCLIPKEEEGIWDN